VSTATTNRPRFTLSPSARKAVLTTHIIVSVGLLGDSAGYLAVAIRAAATSEATVADAAYRMLDMFSVVFGIPLSFAALLTGITLGVGSKWGCSATPG
jgi:hypothetical protein